MKESLVFIVFLIVLTSICDTISQLFLKSSINSLGISVNSIVKIIKFIFRLALVPWVWLGLFFSTASLFIWLFVLSKVDLNFAFSVDSLHYVLIALTSKMILKEKVGLLRWLGTICIMLGVLFVALS